MITLLLLILLYGLPVVLSWVKTILLITFAVVGIMTIDDYLEKKVGEGFAFIMLILTIVLFLL